MATRNKSGKFAPDFMIMTRRKEEDHRRIFHEKCKVDDTLEIVASWEQKTTSKIQRNAVSNQVNTIKRDLLDHLNTRRFVFNNSLPLHCCHPSAVHVHSKKSPNLHSPAAPTHFSDILARSAAHVRCCTHVFDIKAPCSFLLSLHSPPPRIFGAARAGLMDADCVLWLWQVKARRYAEPRERGVHERAPGT